jgi:hypothetical protein
MFAIENLPTCLSRQSKLVINLAAGKALGLDIPPTLFARRQGVE